MNPDILKRLERAMAASGSLSKWEQGFVESLMEQFNKRGRLSPRQVEILARIEEQKLSQAAQEANQKWTASYDDEKRRIAMICAKYYRRTGYFADTSNGIIDNPSFVPSEKAWKKMCQNKYALKVIAAHDADPKYAVGSVVDFRSTANWSAKNRAGGMPCVVISAGGEVVSAAKGSKPYKVLPYGGVVMIECEERHLKKCKKPKMAKKVVDNGAPF
jgi:hypothetical protein